MRRIQVYGCWSLARRWWGEPTELPPALPEGHSWMLLAEVEVPNARR